MQDSPPPRTGDQAYPRLVGANGPGLLHLATDDADGAFPAMKPAAFTAEARRTLGEDKLLVVMQRLDLDPSPADEPRATVDAHIAAGADHVALGLGLGVDFDLGVERAVAVAASLASR